MGVEGIAPFYHQNAGKSILSVRIPFSLRIPPPVRIEHEAGKQLRRVLHKRLPVHPQLIH
jgi:hypothetical protein